MVKVKDNNSFGVVYVKQFLESSQILPLYVKQLSLQTKLDELYKFDTRALTLTGIPLTLTEPNLVSLLQLFGPIHSLTVHNSGLTAIVVFKDEEGKKELYRASQKSLIIELNLSSKGKEAIYREEGQKQWIQNFKAQRPDISILKQQLEIQYEEFEKKQETLKLEKEQQQADEGWVTVGANKKRKDIDLEDQKGPAKRRAPQKDQGIDNFYKFQQKDKKRNDIVELQEKFQQDKSKLQQIRAQRKFKPL